MSQIEELKSGDKGKLVKRKSRRVAAEGHRVEGGFKLETSICVKEREPNAEKMTERENNEDTDKGM